MTNPLPQAAGLKFWGPAAEPLARKEELAMSTSPRYQLRCRECRTEWGNQPVSFCQKCFAPLEVAYDFAAIKPDVSRDKIASRPTNLWRYRELLPLPEQYDASLPVGFTPLVKAPTL